MFDNFIRLSDRYDRLQTGRMTPTLYTGMFQFAGPFLSIGQCMSVCADRKAYQDVLLQLEHVLATTRRKHEHQSRGAAVRARRARAATMGVSLSTAAAFRVWVGSSVRVVRFTYPTLNEYLDGEAISAMRAAYELYKRDDLLSDLVRYFREQVATAPSAVAAIYPRLVLSSILWWNDEREEAIAQLMKVVEASPPESELRIDLAGLLEQDREFAPALAIVDAVQPLDNATLRRREEAALRLAISSGNIERAREAGERLFGLRLDTETQIQLAGPLHQLGLHEMAEAMLGRARRRAGSKVGTLASLMLQYQRQQKIEEAAQAALQILRLTTATGTGQASNSAQALDDMETARAAAIRLLARSGRLPKLIDRAKEELKKTPNSIAVHQALADYYRASAQAAQARSELAKLCELRPDDARLRLQVANQLLEAGQTSSAIEYYRSAFKKEPSLLDRTTLVQMQNRFLESGNAQDLLSMLSEVDLLGVGRGYYLAILIEQLPQDAKLSDQIVTLFRRTWDAFPDDREYLLVYGHRDEIWQMPGMFELASQVIIPSTQSRSGIQAWYVFATTSRAAEADSSQTAIVRFLDLATQQGKLEELGDRVEAVRKNLPSWSAGAAILALVRSREGRFAKARAAIRDLWRYLDKKPVEGTYGLYADWVIGLEFEKQIATRDLAMAAYERCLSHPDSYIIATRESENTPVRRLVDLYVREGRQDNARRALLSFASRSSFPDTSPEETIKMFSLMKLAMVARGLVALGFNADSVPIYSEAIGLTGGLDVTTAAAARLKIGELPETLPGELATALAGLDRDDLVGLAGRLIAEGARKDDPGEGKNRSSRGGIAKNGASLDLMTLIHPRELNKATVRSLLADALEACAASKLASLDESLQAMRQAHPDDYSVAIASALEALDTGKSSRIGPALAQLEQLVAKTPLEPLAEGTKANARQRAVAAQQLPLWLVARACWKHPSASSTHEAGDRLAGRAMDAARGSASPIGCWRCCANRVRSHFRAMTAPGPRRPGARCCRSCWLPSPRPNRRDPVAPPLDHHNHSRRPRGRMLARSKARRRVGAPSRRLRCTLPPLLRGGDFSWCAAQQLPSRASSESSRS